MAEDHEHCWHLQKAMRHYEEWRCCICGAVEYRIHARSNERTPCRLEPERDAFERKFTVKRGFKWSET